MYILLITGLAAYPRPSGPRCESKGGLMIIIVIRKGWWSNKTKTNERKTRVIIISHISPMWNESLRLYERVYSVEVV